MPTWGVLMPALKSTALKRAEYRRDTEELDLTFSSGNTYTYYGVPEAIYEGLISAPSHGEFYN